MMNLTGKKAYKKTGFLAGLCGILERPDYEPFKDDTRAYIIRFLDGSGVMVFDNDVVIIEEKQHGKE